MSDIARDQSVSISKTRLAELERAEAEWRAYAANLEVLRDSLQAQLVQVERENERLRQLEELCRRWFTDDDLSVHADVLREEIMAALADQGASDGAGRE